MLRVNNFMVIDYTLYIKNSFNRTFRTFLPSHASPVGLQQFSFQAELLWNWRQSAKRPIELEQIADIMSSVAKCEIRDKLGP